MKFHDYARNVTRTQRGSLSLDNPNVRIVNQHVLSDNWYLLKKIEFELRLQDGSWQPQAREVYDRGDGATILLYNLTRRTVILTRQFRIPAFVNGHSGYLIEAAAGLLDNASPEERIRLEAEEETGYRVNKVRKVYEAFMSPGSVTERIHFYIGEYQQEDRVSAGGGLADEGEHIEVLELPYAQAIEMVEDGRIMDGKTIILLQYLRHVMPPSGALMLLVVGPYSTGTVNDATARVANFKAMEECARDLQKAGHFPLLAEWVTLPLLRLAGSNAVEDSVYETRFHEYAKQLLQRCDGVVRIGGPSQDADLIESVAAESGLTIFRGLDEVLNALAL